MDARAGGVDMPTGRGFILGTGSRFAPPWLQQEVRKRVFFLSEEARVQHGVRHLTIIHGAAQGVDACLKAWADRVTLWRVDDLPFPADWDAECDPVRCREGHRRARDNGTDYCPAQGSYRNGQMVQFLARMRAEGHWTAAAAFYENARSSGTIDCVRQARMAGFVVPEYGHVPERKTPARR